MTATAASERRLVLFEVAGGAYALPIADVLEVLESSPATAIPMLPGATAGVVNHHGDALPVLSREALLDAPPGSGPPEHVLVVGASGGAAARLGLPVDRVLGLADVPDGPRTGNGLVQERRPVRGRIVAVLDAARLVERAGRLIEEVGGRA